jgi:hypothetical protein
MRTHTGFAPLWSAANVAILFAAFAVALPLQAQWLNYPSPGLPKKADGSPNMDAPAPKLADGHPDFSGIWMSEQNRPCDPQGCRDLPVGEEFFNIGYGLKGGLPYQPWAAALVKQRMADNAKDDPDPFCLPQSIVKMHTAPLMRKYLQMPGLIVILNERNATYRQIFMDGRKLEDDPNPTWRGYSVGAWEGDALVVHSNGFKDDLWMDRNGSPMTSAAKTTERFRRVNYGNLELEITVDDPKAYTRPWTVKLHQVLMPNTELLDFFCEENEKDLSHLVGK